MCCSETERHKPQVAGVCLHDGTCYVRVKTSASASGMFYVSDLYVVVIYQ